MKKPLWRRVLFWAHLWLGVSAGLVIALMAFTGLLLTLEEPVTHAIMRGMVAEKNGLNTSVQFAVAQEMEKELRVAIQLASIQPRAGATLTWFADASLPVIYSTNRQERLLLHPISGVKLSQKELTIESFFRAVTSFHRWLTWSDRPAGRDSKPTWWRVFGGQLTAAACLIYFVLLLTGLLMWFHGWRHPRIRSAKLMPVWGSRGRARAWQWHHAVGFWAAPLITVVTLTGLIMAYPWANTLFFTAFGESVPTRQQRGERRAPEQEQRRWSVAERAAVQQMHSWVAQAVPDWRELTITIPESRASDSGPTHGAAQLWNLRVQTGGRGQLEKKQEWSFRDPSAEFSLVTVAASLSSAQRARQWVRWVHTGEALGIVGQIVAALACLATIVLVWSGLELSWRRFFAAR